MRIINKVNILSLIIMNAVPKEQSLNKHIRCILNHDSFLFVDCFPLMNSRYQFSENCQENFYVFIKKIKCSDLYTFNNTVIETLYDKCGYSHTEIFLEIIFKKNIFHEENSRTSISSISRYTFHFKTNKFLS